MPVYPRLDRHARCGISKNPMIVPGMSARTWRWILAAALLALLLPGTGHTGLAKPRGRVIILAVGINTYAEGRFRYAVADAEALAKAFEEKSRSTPVSKSLLLEKQATREAIEAAFRKVVAEARPNDLFIFYFSGAAFPLKSAEDPDFNLFTFGASMRQPDPAHVISGRLLKAWCSRIQAREQLIIFDAGFTEHLVSAFASRVNSEGAELLELSDRKMEIFGPVGLGFESEECKHGVFTCHFLKGLEGDADAFPRDGAITAEEIQIFVRGKQLQGEQDRPALVASVNIGGDFVVATGAAKSAPAAQPTDSASRGVITGAGVEKPAEPPAPQPAPDAGRNYALLIATDEYESWPKLSNPINDARTIARELKETYGFETQLVENPGGEEMLSLLRGHVKKPLGPNDQLLVFIAGHGDYDEVTEEGFLVARNSKKGDLSRSSYIAHARLRDIVEKFSAGHVLLVMDVCFGGSFDQRIGAGGHRGGDEYAEISAADFRKRKLKYRTRRYLTSGGKEYVPDGRPGQHSPFARKILEALRSYGGKQGYLTIGKISEFVEKVTPEPRAGEFGTNEPGSDFVLISKP